VRTSDFAARTLGIVWVAAWLGPAGELPARAEQSPAEAQAVANHERGLELYQAGRFAEAAQAFEASQALVPAAENLFNLARCYERSGDVARAIAMFEQYLQLDLPPDRRARGQSELERLRAAAGSQAPAPAAEVDLVVATEPAGAELFVDGRPQPQRSPAVLRVSPGEHVVEARLAGHAEARQEVTLEPGRAGRVELTLAPAPPGAPPGPVGGESGAPQPDARRRRLTGSIAVGVGGSFPFDDLGIGSGGLFSLELAGGLDLGRARQWRRVAFWPVRLEVVVDCAAAVADGGFTVVAGGGGRLGLALFRVPLRIEGEVGVDYTLLMPPSDRGDHFGLFFGASVLFQPLPWLEVGLRFFRFDMAYLDSDFWYKRYGVEALVRFRI
jgi:hypothetical protein